MSVIKISDGLYSVGVLNPCLRIFDVIMETEFGTSYNAYLLTGETNVLIDTVHVKFFDEYIENVQSLIALEKIDYIILNHNEPDHSGSLSKLLALAPQAKILTSPAGRIYLPLITNTPLPSLRAVQDGEVLDLGGGRTLQFIHAPFLHWPDSMFTYLESEKTVFTCDFLGAHFCEPTMSDCRIPYMACYEKAFAEYYEAIFSPFKPYVLSGLSKLDDLNADTFCTSHGPILHKGAYYDRARQLYEQWSNCSPADTKYIPIFFCSAYGNTGLLAKNIAEGIISVLSDATVELFDLTEADSCALSAKVNNASALLFGTPTINKDALAPVWQLISHIDAINSKGKLTSAFGSYGWSGEGVPAILTRLKGLNMSVFEEGYRCRFVPSEAELRGAYEFGTRFAAALD